jgi:hypothetical protein
MGVGASERAQEGVADGELLAGMRAGNSAAFAALMRSNKPAAVPAGSWFSRR